MSVFSLKSTGPVLVKSCYSILQRLVWTTYIPSHHHFKVLINAMPGLS